MWLLGLNGIVPADIKLKEIADRSLLDLRDLQLEVLTLSVNAGDVELLLAELNSGFTVANSP